MPTDLSQLPQLVEALSTVASIMERLGVPGLLGLVLLGPVAVIVALMVINHFNTKNLATMHEQARRDMQELVTQMRAENATSLEAYRTDTQTILREFGESQRVTTQYYKDSLELVRGYQRVTSDLSDIIVSSTATLQRVVAISENNMQCPVARESARGRK